MKRIAARLSARTLLVGLTACGIGSSADDLQTLKESAQWLEGQRLGEGVGEEKIARRVDILEVL